MTEKECGFVVGIVFWVGLVLGFMMGAAVGWWAWV